MTAVTVNRALGDGRHRENHRFPPTTTKVQLHNLRRIRPSFALFAQYGRSAIPTPLMLGSCDERQEQIVTLKLLSMAVGETFALCVNVA